MMKDFSDLRCRQAPAGSRDETVIDPAGWEANSLGPVEDWSCHLTSADQDELVAGVFCLPKDWAVHRRR